MLCVTQQCKDPSRAEEGLPPHQAAQCREPSRCDTWGSSKACTACRQSQLCQGNQRVGGGFCVGMQAPWASPAGGSAGSADTAMTTQQGAAAFGWHVTPAPTQTAAPGPLGGGSGAALLSGSRRSRRARRPSTNMQSSLEQEVRRPAAAASTEDICYGWRTLYLELTRWSGEDLLDGAMGRGRNIGQNDLLHNAIAISLQGCSLSSSAIDIPASLKPKTIKYRPQIMVKLLKFY